MRLQGNQIGAARVRTILRLSVWKLGDRRRSGASSGSSNPGSNSRQVRNVMRPFWGFLSLALIACMLSPSSTALADNGVQINQFLSDLEKDRLQVEFIRLKDPPKPIVGLSRPVEPAYSLQLGEGCCGDDVRAKLKEALLGSSPPPALAGGPGALREFRPDYCVFYRDQKRQIRNLWISTSELRMVYFATSGNHPPGKPQDQSRINRNTPGEAREKLEQLTEIANLTPTSVYHDASGISDKNCGRQARSTTAICCDVDRSHQSRDNFRTEAMEGSWQSIPLLTP